MTTECGEREDLPKIVASVIASMPPMIFRVGVEYLRMKKRVQRASKVFEAELVANGIDPGTAWRLAMEYEENSRFVENAMRSATGGFIRMW
jgi:hypothetical protein